MQYISNTLDDQKEMLKTIGVQDIEDLLKDIPQELRLKGLNLPAGISEMELIGQLRRQGQKNTHGGRFASFLGAGVYDHYVPPLVEQIATRGEFITAYTPYQGEASQGTLQSIYEFQSHICLLTGMEVANASMYDGASSAAEAALMVLRHTSRRQILISQAVHPEAIETLRTYVANIDAEIVIVRHEKGETDLGSFQKLISDKTALVLLQNPNFLGYLEPVEELTRIAKKHGAYVAISVNPLALSVLRSPGEVGADIAIGEGQPLGNSVSYGGPHFGFFATSKEFMRRIPGRLCGITEDIQGKRAYVLTLQAREQHIRREKATSNICTNHALCALKATIFLSVLGQNGMRRMAELNVERSHRAYEQLLSQPKVKAFSDAAFFNEFILKIDCDPNRLEKACLHNHLIGPLHLKRFGDEWERHYLVAVTEQRTDEEVERLKAAIREAV